jgi:glycosyltransferase involved in cell wall biosynthesis
VSGPQPPGAGSAPVRVVVMIDSIAGPGGAETLAVENAIRLDPERFERTLCVTRWENGVERTEPAASILARLSEAGVRVIKLRRSSRAALWAWRPLLRVLRRERVDVLHGHLFGSNVWAVILGRLARTPVVVAHEHMWAYGGNRLRPLLDRDLIARFSDAFIAVSEEGRRRMIEVERIAPERITLIPNGIAGFPPGDGARIREELGIGSGEVVVGSVGHLRREKAYEVLIEAAALLRDDRGLRPAVLIAGEGPERPRLEEQIAARGLGDSVRLLGARTDVPDLLAALDVAVCCSDFEGGPLSVMEYMEAGLPVVATDVGGLPELLAGGQTGILVPPRSPGTLATVLAGLIADADERRRMGEGGRRMRRERWSLEAWIARIEALYLELLSGRR